MSEQSETGQSINVVSERVSLPEQNVAKSQSLRTFTQRVRSAFGSKERTVTSARSSTAYPFTENLSFITKYVDTVSKDHVSNIVKTPGYNLLAPYFGLKIFDGQSTKQKEMLSEIANAFGSGEGYTGAAKVVVDKLAEPDVVLSDVSPRKISRIAIWGPAQVENRAQTVAKESIEGHETPVLVAYGGLHALKAVIENSREGDETLIMLPQKENTPEGALGYKIVRSQKDIEVVSLTPEDLLTDKKLSLIDDATHTGDTFKEMRRLFPNATVQDRPLFKT